LESCNTAKPNVGPKFRPFCTCTLHTTLSNFIPDKYSKAVLLTVREQRNILHEIRKQKANWIGHILHGNCLLQRVIEGKIKGVIEVRGKQRRRRRKILDHLKERRGYSHLKEEALDRTM
jgi:hypothetical protein